MTNKKQDANGEVQSDIEQEPVISAAETENAEAEAKQSETKANGKSSEKHDSKREKQDKKAEEYEAKLFEMAAKLDETTKANQVAAEQYLRLRAEFENFRKRSNQEAQSTRVKGIAFALESFFPCMDSIDRAIKMCTDESQTAGIMLIKKQFENALYTLGITEINPLGEKFNPDFHNAVMQEVNPEKVGTVLEVFQKGYAYKDILIRAAMVKVATEE